MRAIPVGCLMFLVGCGDVLSEARAPLEVRLPSESGHAIAPETAAILDDAIVLYERQRFERLRIATDVNERLETVFTPTTVQYLVADANYELMFRLGDEAFEAEHARVIGVGQGPPRGPELPAEVRRVHDGERGGVDAGSCRGCHFSGGADGAGTLTQVALFRGDGIHASAASKRDAPHVMGLGYVSAYAARLKEAIENAVWNGIAQAEYLEAPYYGAVVVDGVNFGNVWFYPDGSVDSSAVTAISPDLVVRPFGHKGRHKSLEELTDEALQAHFGLQSTSREASHIDEADAYLGNGPVGDRDADGVVDEISDAQSMVLAGYMGMLGTPVVRKPTEPGLVELWRDGAELFGEIGCAECHIPEHRLQWDYYQIRSPGGGTTSIPMEPLTYGLEPKPSINDTGNYEVSGYPFYPFTDFRRHDMGEGLAEPEPELLPDGSDAVAGNYWLTRSLWGLADTAPYLHDGRAPTVHDAIYWHGGEAEESRLAYINLDERARSALRVYLLSLTREPTLLVE